MSVIFFLKSCFGHNFINHKDDSIEIFNYFQKKTFHFDIFTNYLEHNKSTLKLCTKNGVFSFKITADSREKMEDTNKLLKKYKNDIIHKFNTKITQKTDAFFKLKTQSNFLRKSELELFFEITKEDLNQTLDQFWHDLSNETEKNNFNLLKSTLNNFEKTYKEINDRFIENETVKYKDLFDLVEKNPLVYTQRRACVANEESNLILAGAGSGKTSVMIARCAYLINTQKAEPHEILLLAFNKTAAKELEERAKKYLPNQKIQTETFHSLGLKILNQSLKDSIKLSPLAGDEDAFKKFISNEIIELLKNNSELMREALRSIASERLDTVSEFDFKTQDEYLEFIKTNQYRTLKGELVKSQGELEIANYLFQRGINYTYEAPYKIKTSNAEKSQYLPDFFLNDFNLYIEFFGIDKNDEVAPTIDKDEYFSAIDWKRQLHKENGTSLIELYHYDLEDQNLTSKLELELNQFNIKENPKYSDLHFEVINDFFETISISEKILNIINLIKTINIDFSTATERLEINEGSKSDWFILKLSFEVFKKYTKHLDHSLQIDFSDMILKATTLIQNEVYKPKWKHILVDEFQDISLTRAELIRSLKVKGPETTLFCVGDDWQAIYHFAGSRSELVREFHSFFGNYWKETIDTTFRFNNMISTVASRFIMQNPLQLQKDIKTIKFSQEPKVNIALKSKFNSELKIIEQFLKKIANKKSDRPSILFLHKDNFPLSKFAETFNKKILPQYQNFEFKFLTYHKSKGLEADYVIALNMKSGDKGFPCEKEFVSIEEKINPASDGFPYAEDRRIFYVILTRAKEEVLLISDMQYPSIFISELINNQYEINLEGAVDHCPECKTGFLVKKKNSDGSRVFLGCSNFQEIGCKYTENIG